MKIRTTKAPIYEGDMPLNMKIDELEGQLKKVFPNMNWSERLDEARILLKINYEKLGGEKTIYR